MGRTRDGRKSYGRVHRLDHLIVEPFPQVVDELGERGGINLDLDHGLGFSGTVTVAFGRRSPSTRTK